jgi:hypothetical protein
MRKFLLLLFVLLNQNLFSSNEPALIPFPQKVEWTTNRFELTGSVLLYSVESKSEKEDESIKQIIALFETEKVKIRKGVLGNENDQVSKTIIIQIIPKLPSVKFNTKEGYVLLVDSHDIVIQAVTREGVFHAVQTLKQLVVNDKTRSYIAGCSIKDWPAFSMRGFMQDVGRNYMSPAFLKKQIDVMAAYKYNIFHFHVTDDPGWRLESKKYPQLQSQAATSRKPGKYYTREEFQDLIKYCAQRHITLIPELDIPGHCAAFRKAFGFSSMSDPRIKQILLDLIDEICDLVPADQMPFLHLGTDEVTGIERPAADLLPSLLKKLKDRGRQVIVWRPGLSIKEDSTSVSQLWSSNGKPLSGHKYLDSRLNYLNHLDALNGIGLLYFDQVCGAHQGDSLRRGGILCCWNDNMLIDETNVIKQNPVYPGMLTYSEAVWTGNKLSTGDKYLSTFPQPGSVEYEKFQDFEDRLIKHRNLYFSGQPFPFVKNANIPWEIIGPFDQKGDLNRQFPIETNGIKQSYQIAGKEFNWRKEPLYGGTIILKHHFGFPSPIEEKVGTVYALTYIFSPKKQTVGCWIGFQAWSRSGRRGGPLPEQGQWHTTNPKVWVNRIEIAPPVWKHPGLSSQSSEIPFVDEDYFYREPTEVQLKKGVNEVLLKVPQGGASWKWMYTFIPVDVKGVNVREVEGLQFSATPFFSSKTE